MITIQILKDIGKELRKNRKKEQIYQASKKIQKEIYESTEENAGTKKIEQPGLTHSLTINLVLKYICLKS